MSTPRTKTIEDVRDVVETEGLDYAVVHYLGAESIEDEDLRRVWQEAHDALGAINAILGTPDAA